MLSIIKVLEYKQDKITIWMDINLVYEPIIRIKNTSGSAGIKTSEFRKKPQSSEGGILKPCHSSEHWSKSNAG